MKNLILTASLLFLISTSLFAQRIFEQNGKFGLKGNDSTVLLKPEYENINLCYSLDEVNTSFQIKIDNTFDDFGGFGEDDFGEGDLDSFGETEGRTPPKYVSVQLNGKKGLFGLGKNGNKLEEILPVEFQSFQAFGEESNSSFDGGKLQILLLQKENKWAIFSPKEQKLTKVNYKFEELSVGNSASGNWIVAKQNGKWGFVDRTNTEIKTNFIHSKKPEFKFENTFLVETLPNKDPRFVMLSKEENKVKLSEYFNLSSTRHSGLIGKKNGAWGVVHTSGIVLLPFEYEKVTFYPSNFSFELRKNGKTGLAFYSGSSIIIDSVESDEDLAVGKTYNPIELKIPVEFDKIQRTEEIYLIEKNNKVGVYSQKGEPILPIEYDDIKKTYKKPRLVVQKNGKQGIISYSENAGKIESKMELPVEYEDLQSDYDLKSGFFAKKDGKYGVINPDYSIALPFEYDSLISYPRYFLKKGGKWGRLELTSKGESLEFKTAIPFKYEGFRRLENSSQFVLVENGKSKLYHIKTNELVSELEFDQVGWEKNGWVWFMNDGEFGLVEIKTGEVTPQEGIASKFSLKWETPIGQTTYRTNIMLANGQIVVGSNGLERGKRDAKDGIYLIDPKTGEINQQLNPTATPKADVNGQAISGDKIFFTNENGESFCYNLSGKTIWRATIKDNFSGDDYYDTESKIGEFENSPALADMNGDGKDDVVFTSEAGQIYVLNGENGRRIDLPKFKREDNYSFLATPLLYDVSGDGTPDILTGGRWNNLMAFDGKTGELLWKRKEPYSVLASATILLEKNELPKVLVASRSNQIDFANLKTGKTEKRIIYDDYALFATPMLTPSKTLVLGTAEPRSEGILQTFQLTKESWKEDEDTKDILFNSKDNAKAKHTANRISSAGFVADVLGNGEFQIGMVSESGEFSLINEQGEIIQQLRLPAGVEAPIFVGDIDSDGKLEIVFACLDGMLRCYETNSEGKVFWGQFRGDNKNSGVMDFR